MADNEYGSWAERRAGYRKAAYKKFSKKKKKYKKTKNPRYMDMRRVAMEVLNTRTAGFAGIEKKFFDTSAISQVPSVAGDATGGEIDPATLLCLNCPAQGDGPSNRDGREITMDSLIVSGACTVSPDALPNTLPTVTVYIYLDTQTNAAQAQTENVWTNPSGNAQTNSGLLRNLEYAKRFTVLKKLVFRPADFVDAQGDETTGTGASCGFSEYINLKGMRVTFIAGQTNSVIGAIADNSIHVAAFTTNSSFQPQVHYNSRLRFRG